VLKNFRLLVNSVLLFTIPAIALAPQGNPIEIHIQPENVVQEDWRAESTHVSSYDQIMELLDGIESGELEKTCSPEQLDRITHYIAFLAKLGVLPDDSEESLSLEDDIDEILNGEQNPYGYALYLGSPADFMIAPAVFYGGGDVVLCKSWVGKKLKKVGKFCKRHKKGVIIGAGVALAVAVVIVVVLTCPPAAPAVASAAASAAGAAGGVGAATRERTGEVEPVSVDPSFTEALLEKEISSMKEFIIEERFFEKNPGVSPEETGRVLGLALAHQALGNTTEYPSNSYLGQLKENLIDQAFFSDNVASGTVENLGPDFRENAYQLRAEHSLELYRNAQAILDLGEVIERNPNNHRAYLERAIAYEEIGDHERSVADYEQYTAKKPTLLAKTIDSSFAFARGISRGAKDSIRQQGTFVADVMIHPINTTVEVCKAFTLLAKLFYHKEWATIKEALIPEAGELAARWDTLSCEEQVEGSAYIFGKYGADIVIPGTAPKLVSKGVGLLKGISSARRILVTAERTLAFETGQAARKLYIPTVVTFDTSEQIIANMDKFAEAGRALDRAGLTKAGRGIAKHGNREGSVFSKPVGTIAEINKHGQEVLEAILNHPDRLIVQRPHPNFGKVIDITVPEKGGVRFTIDGEMIGFLQP